ncbi:hypothetical protein QU38_00900, partial [Staphylococcus aureus]
ADTQLETAHRDVDIGRQMERPDAAGISAGCGIEGMEAADLDILLPRRTARRHDKIRSIEEIARPSDRGAIVASAVGHRDKGDSLERDHVEDHVLGDQDAGGSHRHIGGRLVEKEGRRALGLGVYRRGNTLYADRGNA